MRGLQISWHVRITPGHLFTLQWGVLCVRAMDAAAAVSGTALDLRCDFRDCIGEWELRGLKVRSHFPIRRQSCSQDEARCGLGSLSGRGPMR